MRIVEAHTADQVAKARELFEEYWHSFGFTPCFQGFEEEVASLPGKYAAPGGTLALAMVEDEVAGCVALRRFDETRGEFKRLYVRPAYRGMGLGKVLLDWVIGRARELGYRKLVADTMPQMQKALAMYDQAGFARVAAYAADPTPGAVYLEMTLRDS